MAVISQAMEAKEDLELPFSFASLLDTKVFYVW